MYKVDLYMGRNIGPPAGLAVTALSEILYLPLCYFFCLAVKRADHRLPCGRLTG